MKSLLLFCVVLLGMVSRGYSQTFYETKFVDQEGRNCIGLMIYYSENKSSFRIAFDYKNEWCVADCSYECVSDNSEEGIEVVVMAGEMNDMYADHYSGKDFVVPSFAWIYSDELGDEQYIPYLVFDPEAEADTWKKVEYFEEVSLSNMDQDYVEQFYSEDESEYDLLMKGIKNANTSFNYDDIVQGISNWGTSGSSDNGGDVSNSTMSTNDGKLETIKIDNSKPSSTPSTSSNGARPKMHLLLICNTSIGDIGPSCEVDEKNVTSNFEGIAERLGLEMKKYVIDGDNFTKSNVSKLLSNFTPASNDIVIFYYSGHGFRFSDQKDLYPMMAMLKNEYQSLGTNYISVSDVYNYLQEKGARLNLILTDCCNSDLGVTQKMTGNTLFSRSSNNFDVEKLGYLFLKSEGTLLSTGASPGQYSYCTMQGGYFTLNFLLSLREQISVLNTVKPSWDVLISNTIENVQKQSKAEGTLQRGLKYTNITVK